MTQINKLSKAQTAVLVVLRFLIGWHLLYEGIYKLIHPEWSSIAFLSQSHSGIAEWIVSNSGVLATVDFLNAWGLTAIGLGLILGLFANIAAYAGVLLLLLYYFFNFPSVSATGIGTEGNYLLISKNLIEAATLLLLALFNTSKVYGLDRFLISKKK